MVRKLYESHARPFTRVVHGLPMSWNRTTAAVTHPSRIRAAAWSPCDRFIAIVLDGTMKVEVLDSATLQQLQTLETLQAQPISTEYSALAFSPDSRMLTYSGPSSSDQELFVVSWDLQTGDVASIIRWRGQDRTTETPSITYSTDGKTFGVRCRYSTGCESILVFDVASGVYVHSHSPAVSFQRTDGIWIHGESLRFTTISRKTITIWEVGLTSDAIPTEVETFPFPRGVGPFNTPQYATSDEELEGYFQFHPAPCRLALNCRHEVVVWDVQNSKYLLRCTGTWFSPYMTFSSDGRFFASSTYGSGVYLWKESATGDYILHEILGSKTALSRPLLPLLSRNGELIFVFGGATIQLWRTKGYTTTPPGVSTRAPGSTEGFLLDFSSDGMLAAVAREWDRTVTVLDLKSGVLPLTIDADMKVYGLGVIGNTITVVGREELITWDLPTGDRVPGAKMAREDSVRTTLFRDHSYGMASASISPDSRYFAITNYGSYDDGPRGRGLLQLLDGSTGEELVWYTITRFKSFFAPGGRDLWLVDDDGCGEVLRVGDWKEEQWDPVKEQWEERWEPEGIVDIEDPPEGYPWASSRGYRITDNWWILGPDGKRLLMLPPLWQSFMTVRRVWKGQYLALLHRELPEPVILELYQ